MTEESQGSNAEIQIVLAFMEQLPLILEKYGEDSPTMSGVIMRLQDQLPILMELMEETEHPNAIRELAEILRPTSNFKLLLKHHRSVEVSGFCLLALGIFYRHDKAIGFSVIESELGGTCQNHGMVVRALRDAKLLKRDHSHERYTNPHSLTRKGKQLAERLFSTEES